MIYITIDGPAGSGKSSVSRDLAKKLGFKHLDTGALYRAATFLWIKFRKGLTSQEFLKMIKSANFYLSGDSTLYMNGKSLGEEIRTVKVGKVVSKVAEVPEIREIITQKAREIANGKCIVVEGRDIGTVVLPNACVKIFLTASVDERAHRRYEDYKSRGVSVRFEEVVKEIELRDKIDSTREVAPLKPAKDAIIFSTDGFTFEEVVNKLYSLIMEKMKQC